MGPKALPLGPIIFGQAALAGLGLVSDGTDCVVNKVLMLQWNH